MIDGCFSVSNCCHIDCLFNCLCVCVLDNADIASREVYIKMAFEWAYNKFVTTAHKLNKIMNDEECAKSKCQVM